ncbi:hypothetical protein OBO34_07230 [Clostridiales Family XIII bacterium ASD5510]|uniref:Uncharacterized protein n=1 Tax=Hominibacterium faecale TaxID=2839743 RepID=A0A9J6QLV1_9FIRM|nr:hypothetical protein [Hominibacterium faecale]MCU7378145.1 hypothetical protein [Hominibacterium faecale]
MRLIDADEFAQRVTIMGFKDMQLAKAVVLVDLIKSQPTVCDMDVVRATLKELYKYKELGTLKDLHEVKEKQVAKKPVKVDVQPYIRKKFADSYTCPICHRQVERRWNGCPHCLQRLEWEEAE